MLIISTVEKVNPISASRAHGNQLAKKDNFAMNVYHKFSLEFNDQNPIKSWHLDGKIHSDCKNGGNLFTSSSEFHGKNETILQTVLVFNWIFERKFRR